MSTAMTVGWLELRDAALGAARRGWPITPGTFLGLDRRWRGRDGASALYPVQDTWCDAPVAALDRAWEIWDARPYSVLLVRGRGIDALALPPRLSWLLSAPEVPRAPLATVTPSRGWLLVAATGSSCVADGLAQRGVRLRSRGAWAPLPPTAAQFLVPGRWVTDPPQPGVGRLPTTDEVQHGLLSALRSGASATGSAG